MFGNKSDKWSCSSFSKHLKYTLWDSLQCYLNESNLRKLFSQVSQNLFISRKSVFSIFFILVFIKFVKNYKLAVTNFTNLTNQYPMFLNYRGFASVFLKYIDDWKFICTRVTSAKQLSQTLTLVLSKFFFFFNSRGSSS